MIAVSTPDKRQNRELLLLANAARMAAQKRMGYSHYAYFLACICSVLSLFMGSVVSIVLAVIGTILAGSGLLIRSRCMRIHYLSREAQRLALLEDSLGRIAEDYHIVELRRKMGVEIEKKAKTYLLEKSYYRSKKPRGQSRLKENMQQSSFWSKALLDKYSFYLYLIVLIYVVAMIATLVIYVVIHSKEPEYTGNIAVLIVSTLVLLGIVLEEWRAARSVKLAVEMLEGVDNQLDTVYEDDSIVIISKFADYGISVTEAPPIPYIIYAFNKDHLRGLWDKRLHVRLLSVEELSGSMDLPTIDMEDCMPPTWIDDGEFKLLLLNTCLFVRNRFKGVMITRVTVNGLPGYSGVGVYSLKYFADNSTVIQYVLRLHEEEEQARREYNTIEKISSTGFDVFAYVPVGEPYIAHGALLYTHANHQTYDVLKHLHVFLGDLINDSDLLVEVRLRKLSHGIRTLIKALSSIEKPEYITTLDYYKNNTLNFPPRNILDLRNTTHKIADGIIHIDCKSERGGISVNDGPLQYSKWL
ncbi:MAG: hypothetical protein WBL85_08160 [Sedimentisphaerales bacterium]